MWFAGLWLDEMPLPSPKFHDQMLLQPGVVMSVELLVVSNWVTFFLPLVGLTVKLEIGTGQTTLAVTSWVTVLDAGGVRDRQRDGVDACDEVLVDRRVLDGRQWRAVAEVP